MSPTRPALRYLGGKWLLAPWIINNLPEHTVYTESFGGGASVLLRKPRAPNEIYNDLDGTIVNYFRVMRSSRSEELINSIRMTPFSREEFILSYEVSDCPIEEARRLLVRSFMGFGSDGTNRNNVKTGFRASVRKKGGNAARDWSNLPNSMKAISERLQGVVIEKTDAKKVITKYDNEHCLHYVDPPYVHATRSAKRLGGKMYHSYAYELCNAEHAELIELLGGVRGYVVLSGYDSDLYNDRLKDWSRVEKQTKDESGNFRTEFLWINPRAALAIEKIPPAQPSFLEERP